MVAPRAVRWAALVVAVEVAALAAGMAGLLYLTATGSVASVGNAVGLAVVVAVLGIALGACAVGLRRVALWARTPVVVLQIILGMIGYTAAFQAGQPTFGIPVLVLVALELYLLATPEARLAFFRHTDA